VLSAFAVRYPWFCPLISTASLDPFGVALWLNAVTLSRVMPDGTRQQGWRPALGARSLTRLKDAVDRCLSNPDVKLIGFTLIIGIPGPTPRRRCGHSNALIYDRETNAVERWEPAGINTSAACDPGAKLDASLRWLFRHLFGWKYMRPQASCPLYRGARQPGMVQGFFKGDSFCVSWSLLYMETRLSNPGMSGELVSRLLAKVAAGDPRIAESSVRRYAAIVLEAYNDHARFRVSDLKSLAPVTASSISAVTGKHVPDGPVFPDIWP
jgi:hypothetical protein